MDRDAELERELRLALDTFDPVPPRLVHTAIEALTWRTIDAELAQLAFDSLAMSEDATVRGTGAPRLLTFEGTALSIELELTSADASPDAARARRVIGRLVPAQAAEVELQVGNHRVNAAADALGRFALTVPASGPFRLRCQPAAGPEQLAVVTEWVTA
jgi:hypothetical protein